MPMQRSSSTLVNCALADKAFVAADTSVSLEESETLDLG